MKVFMFVNVDWFFLSHRLAIAQAGVYHNVNFTVFTDFTEQHPIAEYKNFHLLQSPLKRSSKTKLHSLIEWVKVYLLIRKSKPDLVHAVTIKPIIVLGVICRITKTPFVASISGLGPAFKVKNIFEAFRLRVITLIYKFVFGSKKSEVICQTQKDIDILTSINVVSRAQTSLIEGSGVELSKYLKTKSYACPPVNVLMASRILADKGVYEFCASALRIKEETNFDVHFSLAGPIDKDSPTALQLVEIESICNKSKVQYLGNRSDLHLLLNTTDIFVLPSYYPEGLPKVLLEAAASGCAIVTTDHSGCRDAIIPGKTGVLVEPQDSNSLMDGILKFLRDPKSIRLMGANGRLLAEKRFCQRSVVKKHYKIYEKFRCN
jgi:glycosyltransferase involved in cell wall biosynthesis